MTRFPCQPLWELLERLSPLRPQSEAVAMVFASTDDAARALAVSARVLDHELLEVVVPVTLHGDNLGGLEANGCQ